MADVANLSQYYNDPSLQASQANADSAAQTAVNYQSAAGQLPAKLRQAIQEKVDYNKDIIDEQAKAQANYFAAPATARSDYQNIWNPFDREKLVAQATANAYKPFASLTDILGERRGNINDIVNAGTGAFNSAVSAQQGNAQIARQSYMDKLGLQDKLASIAQWNYEQTHKGGGGGDDLSNALSMIYALQNKQQGAGAQGAADLSAFEGDEGGGGGAPGLSQPLSNNVPSWWDNLLGMLGATPKQDQQQNTSLGTGLSDFSTANYANLPGLNYTNNPNSLRIGR